jgi:hypothetical protein
MQEGPSELSQPQTAHAVIPLSNDQGDVIWARFWLGSIVLISVGLSFCVAWFLLAVWHGHAGGSFIFALPLLWFLLLWSLHMRPWWRRQRLIIGTDRLQLQELDDTVLGQVPFHNIAEILPYVGFRWLHENGSITIRLRDAGDPETFLFTRFLDWSTFRLRGDSFRMHKDVLFLEGDVYSLLVTKANAYWSSRAQPAASVQPTPDELRNTSPESG